MAEKIDGPLVRVTDTNFDRNFAYEAPEKSCPDCGVWLRVVGGWFYGGIYNGVTWTFRCPECSALYEWQDAWDYHVDAYGSDHEAGPRR